MQELKLISAIPPSVNHYLAYRVIMQGKRPLACSYKTKIAREYQKDFIKYICEEVEKQGWNMESIGDKHIFVDTVFYFPRGNMDCNNYFKVLLDSITDSNVVWDDDNIVCERVQRIYYDAENPHVELVIHPVEYAGVFNNVADLTDFENKCLSCSRYQRNCSLLRKAKDGYIQTEISNDICLSYKTKK